jgi:hypothetical protein
VKGSLSLLHGFYMDDTEPLVESRDKTYTLARLLAMVSRAEVVMLNRLRVSGYTYSLVVNDDIEQSHWVVLEAQHDASDNTKELVRNLNYILFAAAITHESEGDAAKLVGLMPNQNASGREVAELLLCFILKDSDAVWPVMPATMSEIDVTRQVAFALEAVESKLFDEKFHEIVRELVS